MWTSISDRRSAGELEHMPYTLMWQELRAGCRLVWGDPACLERWRLNDWRLLPVSEAARLLLNRAAGLLLAAAKLDEDSAGSRGSQPGTCSRHCWRSGMRG